MFKRIFPALLGILAGVLCIALAVVLYSATGDVAFNYNSQPAGMSSSDTGTRTGYKSYGGDAYTGIQQAAADTARNVKTQSEIIISGFRSLPGIIYGSMPTGFSTSMTGYAAILLALGLAMICYFANKIAENCARAKYEDKVLAALNALKVEDKPAEVTGDFVIE